MGWCKVPCYTHDNIPGRPSCRECEWGSVAANIDERTALIIAAIGLGLGLLTGLKFKLIGDIQSKSIKESASMYWSSPIMFFEPSLEAGPVLVKIEYKIDNEGTTTTE